MTTLTTNHIERLIKYFSDRTVAELVESDMFDVVTALMGYVNTTTTFNIDISYSSNGSVQWIDGIKILRILTGLGLKEAKDLYETRDPSHLGGTVGPFTIDKPTSWVKDILAKHGWNHHSPITIL